MIKIKKGYYAIQKKEISKLLNWKNECNGEKAILIESARRIGKSTVAEEFSKAEYDSYILIDFAKEDKTVEGFFLNYLNDLDTFFMLLSTYYGISLIPRKSVIIFDEIQRFPQARAAIKYLVADRRYDYIETGSLIFIKENIRNIVIPSEERSIRMYPLDFEEFCWALGEEILIEYIKKCFDNREPLERSLHDKAMLLFKQYMLIGGMPKVLSTFIEEHKAFTKADIEKRDILNLYRNDIMRIDSNYKAMVLSIYDQIPGLLSKHEKRIVFKDIKEGTSFAKYEETFFWLSDSMIANMCFFAEIRMQG